MTRLRLLAAALLVLSSTGALAQSVPGAADPSRVSGGTYEVDPDHTQVIWTVYHMGFTPLSGMFGKMSGTLALDPEVPDEAKLEITIPMAGLVVTSDAFAEHLAGPEIFNAADTPLATFRSTKVTSAGIKAKIEGELTLHGITRPVVLEALLFGAGIDPMTQRETVGFTATGRLRRSDFGLGFGTPAVSDAVSLNVVGAFARRP